jgi:hypothetical protein
VHELKDVVPHSRRRAGCTSLPKSVVNDSDDVPRAVWVLCQRRELAARQKLGVGAVDRTEVRLCNHSADTIPSAPCNKDVSIWAMEGEPRDHREYEIIPCRRKREDSRWDRIGRFLRSVKYRNCATVELRSWRSGTDDWPGYSKRSPRNCNQHDSGREEPFLRHSVRSLPISHGPSASRRA